MIKTPFDQQLAKIFSNIDTQRAVLLTPNQRLSRFFIDRYASLQSQGAFGSLKCLAVNLWIQELWSDLQFLDDHPFSSHAILTGFQENLLWEKVLEECPDTPPLINARATARQAQEAWRLVHEWRLNFDQLQEAALQSGDSFLFQRWAKDFEQACRMKQYLSAVELPALLVERLEKLNPLPQEIYLYGFDEYSPALQNLLSALENLGTKISPLDLQVAQHKAQRVEFTNEQQELESVARWARQQIEAEPDQTIAIVVPDLTAQRARVERVFMREFEPQYIFPNQAQHATGFNISAGQPLAQVPLVKASLAALQCQLSSLDIDQLSSLLLSPFIGSVHDLPNRALLDVALRDAGELNLTFQQFKTLIGENVAQLKGDNQLLDAERLDFYQHLSAVDLLRKKIKSLVQYPSEWSQTFVDLLKAWNWPGERELDTVEYQQLQSWQGILEEFSGLDYFLGPINQSKAIEIFSLALQQSSFHLQTRKSPLQILGLLEAAGLVFDQLWVIGLDDDTWPPLAKPNPLLPIHMQTQLNLPQSSATREFHFAQRLSQRLAQGSVQLIASSVQSKGDKQLSASPLIAEFPLLDFTISAKDNYEQQLFSSRSIETILDYDGPPIVDLDAVRGGSQILKSQAACPFQAFARYRLHSSEIPTPEIGLNNLERGNLLHKVMEIIWRILQDQSQLLALSDDQLLSLIHKATAQALMDIRHKRVAGQRFLALETQRLSAQVLHWLQLEKRRQPFKVLFNEGRKTVKLEEMPIHIRFDRVDELNDGSLFVLDYKTGTTNIRDWAGNRPNEPQVPLYAVANASRVVGAAFGQISAAEIAFKGIAQDSEIAPGLIDAEDPGRLDLPNNWADILLHWEKTLARLAQEFLAGSAAVDPKQPALTCRYCELQSLCRIREQFDFDSTNNQIEFESDNLSDAGDFADAK